MKIRLAVFVLFLLSLGGAAVLSNRSSITDGDPFPECPKKIGNVCPQ